MVWDHIAHLCDKEKKNPDFEKKYSVFLIYQFISIYATDSENYPYVNIIQTYPEKKKGL